VNKDSFIYVAGHRGMVGSAIIRKLKDSGYNNILTFNGDLTVESDVTHFFESYSIDYVFLAAAKVGGIEANRKYPVEFMQDNLLIQTNVLKCAHKFNVSKLLFLGSSCIYPKLAKQPIKEEYLLTSFLEPTNEAYALAKIAGLRLCKYYQLEYGDSFISAMPCNLYGPGDNFSLEGSHVIPAMIRKFHEAKESGSPTVGLWGSGEPLREFLYVDDLADALLYLMDSYDDVDHINVGYGTDVSIANLANFISQAVGYKGDIVWNTDMPDGTFRKLMDSSKMNNLGWEPPTSLIDGIDQTYKWFLENQESFRGK
jgi:GDP-L-fucose synthase